MIITPSAQGYTLEYGNEIFMFATASEAWNKLIELAGLAYGVLV